ncbi:MAG: heparinase II/III family protein, partial [Clostridia bacterium]|nr:heparinase II/III family protein [Clostridia bacterium]
DAMADLHRAEALMELDFPREKKSMLFPDSRMAVLRKGKMTLFADAMEWLGGHQHVGRPQILLYYGNEPVIVDSGCCSYDRWEFYLALNANKMHNVLWCPDFEDKKCSIDPQIKSFDAEEGIIELETAVTYEGKSYTWNRTLHLEDHKLTIDDTAESAESLRWASRLFFKQNDTHAENANTILQLTEEYMMRLTTDAGVETELVPVMNDYNKIDYAVMVQAAGTGNRFTMHTEIEFKDR